MYYCYHNSKGLDVYEMENAMDTVLRINYFRLLSYSLPKLYMYMGRNT